MDDLSPDHRDLEPVPIFGTWPRIYAAVVVLAVVVMGLIGLFARWSY